MNKLSFFRKRQSRKNEDEVIEYQGHDFQKEDSMDENPRLEFESQSIIDGDYFDNSFLSQGDSNHLDDEPLTEDQVTRLPKRAKYNARIDRFLTNGIIIVTVLLIAVLLIAFLV